MPATLAGYLCLLLSVLLLDIPHVVRASDSEADKEKNGDSEENKEGDKEDAIFDETKVAKYGDKNFCVLLKDLKSSEGKVEPPFTPEGENFKVLVHNADARLLTLFITVDVTRYDINFAPEVRINDAVQKYRIIDGDIPLAIRLDEHIGEFDKTYNIEVRDPKPATGFFAGAAAAHTYVVRIMQAPDIVNEVKAKGLHVYDRNKKEIFSKEGFDAESGVSTFHYGLYESVHQVTIKIDCHDDATNESYDAQRYPLGSSHSVNMTGPVLTSLAQCVYEAPLWTEGKAYEKTYTLQFNRIHELKTTEANLHMIPSQGKCYRADDHDVTQGFICQLKKGVKIAGLIPVVNNTKAELFLEGQGLHHFRIFNGLPAQLDVSKGGDYKFHMVTFDHKRVFPVQIQRPTLCADAFKCPAGWVKKDDMSILCSGATGKGDGCSDDKDTPICCDRKNPDRAPYVAPEAALGATPAPPPTPAPVDRWIDERTWDVGLQSTCNGNQVSAEKCEMDRCPSDCQSQDCTFSDWSAWTGADCSGLCERLRNIMQPNNECGTPCSGALIESKACSTPCHPPGVECKLGDWTDWMGLSPRLTANGLPTLAIFPDSSIPPCRGADNTRKSRYREIERLAAHGGRPCTGALNETEKCDAVEVVDCELSGWTEWSSCSSVCGPGQSLRTRKVVKEATFNGTRCNADTTETRACTAEQEPICPEDRDCEWGEWNLWSACTCSCGGGQQTRVRIIAHAPTGSGKLCDVQDRREMAPCNTQTCTDERCIDGAWGPWSSFGHCSAPCNGGVHWRSRSVIREANHCGKVPIGNGMEVEVCNDRRPIGEDGGLLDLENNRTMVVPIGLDVSGIPMSCQKDLDCLFLDWAEWGSCSCTQDGVQTRVRNIERFGAGDGTWCKGSLKEVAPCNTCVDLGDCEVVEPPQDCKLGDWSNAKDDGEGCSVTCGQGSVQKTRDIVQEAKYGGAPCAGELSVVEPCELKPCLEPDAPKPCVWGDWDTWGACDKCGGQTARIRQIRHMPESGGAPCEPGSSQETMKCERQCHEPTNCEWTDWNDGPCSVDCGGGFVTRQRHLQPKKERRLYSWTGEEVMNTPYMCQGAQTSRSTCGMKPCDGKSCEPLDCEFGPWSTWDDCQCTGITERTRLLKRHNNECGQPCDGPLSEAKTCIPSCHQNHPVDCLFAQWSPWQSQVLASYTEACGKGASEKSRSRKLTPAMNGGRPCTGEMEEIVACPVEEQTACELSDWSDWNSCSVTCGRQGQKSRARTVTQHASLLGASCTDNLVEVAPCDTDLDCGGDQDCVWGGWADWSDCTCSCDGGQMERKRIVKSAPRADGKLCDPEDRSELAPCATQPCHKRVVVGCSGGHSEPALNNFNGGVAGMTAAGWVFASSTKDGAWSAATQFRPSIKATCAQCPVPNPGAYWGWDFPGNGHLELPLSGSGSIYLDYGNAYFEGQVVAKINDNGVEYVAPAMTVGHKALLRFQDGDKLMIAERNPTAMMVVNSIHFLCDEACVDGAWSSWSDYGKCSAACEGGVRWRARGIAKEASWCGLAPEGPSKEFEPCNTHSCQTHDVDCEFGTWSDWGDCSCTDNGVQARVRSIEVEGLGKGAWCVGAMKDLRGCNAMQLIDPVDCKFGDWKHSSNCTGQCGTGSQTFVREVVQKTQGDGAACEGPVIKVEACPHDPCPTPAPTIAGQPCVWDDWQEWFACDKCSGQRKRNREILTMPEDHGMPCEVGASEEIEKCPRHCHDNFYCEWGDWQKEGSCSVSCGTGTIRRVRYLKSLPHSKATHQMFERGYEASLERQTGLYEARRSRPLVEEDDRSRLQDVVIAFACGGLMSFAVFIALVRRQRRTYAAVRSEPLGRDMYNRISPQEILM